MKVPPVHRRNLHVGFAVAAYHSRADERPADNHDRFPVGRERALRLLAGISRAAGRAAPRPDRHGEVIDPEDLRRGADPGLGQDGDQPQQRGPVRRGAQRGGQPGPGPARRREPDLGQ
jgi:hypothetical protein